MCMYMGCLETVEWNSGMIFDLQNAWLPDYPSLGNSPTRMEKSHALSGASHEIASSVIMRETSRYIADSRSVSRDQDQDN